MVRNRNKKGNRGRVSPRNPNSPPSKSAAASPEQQLKAAHDEAASVANDEDMTAVKNEPMPDGLDAKALWRMAQEARDIFRSARKRYEARTKELDDQDSRIAEGEASLAARGRQLDVQGRELGDKLAALHERESEASTREAALTEREIEIRGREINAEQGFVAERRAMLAQLEESLAELRATLRETEREIAGERKAWHDEERGARAELHQQLNAERETFRARLAEERQANEARLAEGERALAEERRELESARRRLGYEKQDIDDLRADLDNRAEQRMAAIREELGHRIRSLDDQLEQARSDRDTHEAVLRQREEADRKFGHRTPEEVLNELDVLRTERDELRTMLAERPDADATARLAGLESEREGWQAERIELRRQVSELKRRLAYSDNDATEREVLRDQVTSLESQRQLLHKAHEQIRSEIDDLLSRTEARSPFPACTTMDEDSVLQSSESTSDDIGDLREFVEDLQHRIASDPEHPEPLYYTPADLRSFVGGLAMSRLVLLQGISGTGKTSLPMAFARAVGTTAAVIKVQAGWRDPQDLVGHYNTFEKRFDEKGLLQALYRAGTQRYRDTLQVVLLDEMNLSHPEQYFSDLLSALELPTKDRCLELMTHSVESPPSLFREGSKLPIQPNLWFVGTANHDETTMDFADKTYDRSHVMEFPHRPERFDVNKPSPRPPVSVVALRKAFRTAIQQRSTAAEKVIGFLDSNVRDPLARDFEVGWGPRLERQVRHYVPVVAAAGGTVGEATDHVLAMRLLRKLRNRHDNRPEHLEKLRQRIEESWPGLDNKGEPTRSVEVLDSELRRLGRATDHGE